MTESCVLTGATGFLGRLLALRLARDGVRVTALVRDAARARAVLGDGPELRSSSISDPGLRAEIAHADFVIHLAGEPLFGPRWSSRRRAELTSSRVELTARLARAIAGATRKPRVLISASAVGFYGASDDRELDETSPCGLGFAAQLCRAWEAAASPAIDAGVRTVLLRTGVVLGPGGGALATMLPPFRCGVGGRLGSGRQWMPWIHIEDWLELVVRALRDDRLQGPLNATAPHPVTNADFTRALGRALHRPTPFPAPAFGLRLALGAAASMLLTGQRVLPRKALAVGHPFRFATIDTALAELVTEESTIEIETSRDEPDVEYLRERKPRYLLSKRTLLRAPLEDVFEFFARSENLGAITPPNMTFESVASNSTRMHEGREIDYAFRIGPLPMRWTSRIERWSPPDVFVDRQLSGPYRAWWHEHRFIRSGKDTLMEDRVWYAPPLGALGALAQRWWIAPQLRAIFSYRARMMRLRFGTGSLDATPKPTSGA